MKSINEIIDKYRGYEQLYEVLKQFYTENEVSIEDEVERISKIKKIITSYYLYAYKFKTYSSDEIQDELLSNISRLCDLSKKVKDNNGQIKIYPVKESDENKERTYKKVMKEMVDYQIKNNISIEEVFDIFVNKIGNQLKDFKQMLMQNDMELYYGSTYYIVVRSIFIINCIKQISNKSLNLEEIENTMLQYKQKYIDSRDDFEKEDDFSNVNDEFYTDYDLIESYYKKLLIMENELSPIVIDKWKNYLTSPFENNDNYRYVVHCFSSGMVNPDMMNKACCSLYTPTIENLMYGDSGLIYDIDADSIDTMCPDDAGSWSVNKELFIERECPSRWQLTRLDGDTVFYEYPLNSKLILPNVFETECNNRISAGKFHYSEIFLNKNARPIGMFYTNKCQNIEEVKLYAERNNLPLVNMDFQKTKSK